MPRIRGSGLCAAASGRGEVAGGAFPDWVVVRRGDDGGHGRQQGLVGRALVGEDKVMRPEHDTWLLRNEGKSLMNVKRILYFSVPGVPHVLPRIFR
jgi:hypothetical protein